ncbi:MAG: hypothetical protein LUH07_01040 [Lachnospiraceae bacterium]|nr:hypothetical protein [Lachnospiraceae bacterium]
MDKTESNDFSTEDRILTIPNAMSLFRLLLIPVIVWLYKVRHQYRAAGDKENRASVQCEMARQDNEQLVCCG